MTPDEIGVKFTALGKGVIGEAKCKQAGEWIMALEQHGSVGGLFDLTVV